ncbi:MAG: stage II sporulation protein P [Thermaerobacter sp.]|nr:stage II sporulation protein P [Thermaerobacter sp.]
MGRRLRVVRLPRMPQPPLLLAYLALVVLALALAGLPRPAHPKYLPTLAPLSTARSGVLFGIWRPGARVLRFLLDQAAPALSGAPRRGVSPRGSLSLLLRLLGGVDGTSPAAFLAAAIPALPGVPPAPANPPGARPPYPTPPTPVLYGRHPLIGIYHSISKESFLSALGAGRTPLDAYSSDQRRNVVRVGTFLARYLWQNEGLSVAHSLAVNDYQGIIGAYRNSRRTARDLLRRYHRLRVLLDLERGSGTAAQSVTVLRGHRYARVLLVVGTGARLPDPSWHANLSFAHRLAAALRRLAPPLLIGIRESRDRLNQEVLPGALQVEIGGPYNTLRQEQRTSRVLAAALDLLDHDGTLPARP